MVKRAEKSCIKIFEVQLHLGIKYERIYPRTFYTSKLFSSLWWYSWKETSEGMQNSTEKKNILNLLTLYTLMLSENHFLERF